jgi:hypothetical protein
MIAIYIIIGFVLLAFSFSILHDYFLFKKFKTGYFIELYNIQYVSNNSYIFITEYEIIANKNKYILVKDKNGNIQEFDLYELISMFDKIIIKDSNGFIKHIQYKIESYGW